jgi:hypothetical protein
LRLVQRQVQIVRFGNKTDTHAFRLVPLSRLAFVSSRSGAAVQFAWRWCPVGLVFVSSCLVFCSMSTDMPSSPSPMAAIKASSSATGKIFGMPGNFRLKWRNRHFGSYCAT